MTPRSEVAALLAKSHTIGGMIDRAIGLDDETARAARRMVDSITGPARQESCAGWGSLPLCDDPWCQGCDKEVVVSPANEVCSSPSCECRGYDTGIPVDSPTWNHQPWEHIPLFSGDGSHDKSLWCRESSTFETRRRQ